VGKKSQRLATIIKLEKEITEIKKVVNQAYHRLNTLEQECKEIRDAEEAEQLQQPDGSEQEDAEQHPAAIERAELPSVVMVKPEQEATSDASDFTCSSCSVTKPIDQRERETRKTKIKNAANSLKRMEHLNMNVFAEVHFRNGN